MKCFRIFLRWIVLQQLKNLCCQYPLWYHCVPSVLSVFLFLCPLFLLVKTSTWGFASVVLLDSLFPIINASVRTWSESKWRWGNVFPSDQQISDMTLNRWLSNAEIHIWIKGVVCRNAFFSLRDSSQYWKWDENWIFAEQRFHFNWVFFPFILLLSVWKIC